MSIEDKNRPGQMTVSAKGETVVGTAETKSNVVQLPIPPPLDRPLFELTVLTTRDRVCAHRFRLVEKERRVICSECERVFEPYDALREIGNQWDRYSRQLRDYREEIQKLSAEKKTLHKEVRNLKAAKRRVTSRLDVL